MRVLVTVLCLVGCASSQRAPVKRWPYHREQSDARLVEMQRKIDALEQRLNAIEAASRAKPAPPP